MSLVDGKIHAVSRLLRQSVTGLIQRALFLAICGVLVVGDPGKAASGSEGSNTGRGASAWLLDLDAADSAGLATVVDALVSDERISTDELASALGNLDANESLREKIAIVIGIRGRESDEALEQVFDMLSDASPLVANQAEVALGGMAPGVIPRVIDEYPRSTREGRKRMASILFMNHGIAGPALRFLVVDARFGPPDLRLAASHTALIISPDQVGLFQDAVEVAILHGDHATRLRAAWWLGYFTSCYPPLQPVAAQLRVTGSPELVKRLEEASTVDESQCVVTRKMTAEPPPIE